MDNKRTAAITLILFSLTDMINTLTVIERGGLELNPIMDYYLSIGIEAFILIKLFLTFGCVHIIYKYSSTNILLTLSALYFILISYQFYIL